MVDQPTTKDIVTQIGVLSDKMDVLTDMVHGLAVHMDQRFNQVYAEMATKEELNDGLAKVRAEMSTKDFVERRLEASEEHIVQNLGAKIDRVDAKVEKLVDVLEDNEVITPGEAKTVLSVTPASA